MPTRRSICQLRLIRFVNFLEKNTDKNMAVDMRSNIPREAVKRPESWIVKEISTKIPIIAVSPFNLFTIKRTLFFTIFRLWVRIVLDTPSSVASFFDFDETWIDIKINDVVARKARISHKASNIFLSHNVEELVNDSIIARLEKLAKLKTQNPKIYARA